MKKIAIFIDTINAAQQATVSELLSKNKDNTYIGLNLKKVTPHPNLKDAKDTQAFLDFCCSAQDLILIAPDNFSVDEKMLNSFFPTALEMFGISVPMVNSPGIGSTRTEKHLPC
ncbi:hypothetical protein PspS19_18595 [Pseudomonas sp. S19]|uniref:hypothetical protein n=1 Tax=Pseudomonas sp. S19 TaxID=322535 RepID=UPI00132EB0CD|nr:hypothetical protein [Pseudomonas sp. S19]QHF34725.1 hypothetical protein PspS19_18595 [Pseudomonas sp. S19]